MDSPLKFSNLGHESRQDVKKVCFKFSPNSLAYKMLVLVSSPTFSLVTIIFQYGVLSFQEEWWIAKKLTHLMSVQNCKNDEFLSAPKERRGNRRVVYHALGTHLAQEATPEFPPSLHSGIWIRTEGNLSICMAALPPIICGS